MTQQLSRRSWLGGAVAGIAHARKHSELQRPDQSAAGPKNLLVIVTDTWGANYLGCYGNAAIHTPHVDALASQSALFTEAYAESLPTIPARRVLYTGRRAFPSQLVVQPGDPVAMYGWHQLFAEDTTLAEQLRTNGYTTSLISDLYHQFKPGKNFHRGFEFWRWIRGQYDDPWEADPRASVRVLGYLHPSQVGGLVSPTRQIEQYLANRRTWRTEDDWSAAQVFREAARWLENTLEERKPFYLHVESFSPHEFWDPPEPYYREYMKGSYSGPQLVYPPLTTSRMSLTEIEHARALFAGYVTFVDRQIGHLLARVEELGLMRSTLIAFTSDHGTLMGEQNQFHKAASRCRVQVTHVPLVLYHPSGGWAGRRVAGFVQHVDLMPTLLEALGVPVPTRVTGNSLVSAIEKGRAPEKPSIVIGYDDFGSVRTPEWNYIGRWEGEPDGELYDVVRDPEELRNVAAEHPDVLKELRRALLHHVESGWKTTAGTFAEIAGPVQAGLTT